MEAKIYLPLCEQYHSLAKNFFAQYVDITSGQHPATSDWLENPEESTRLMCFHIAQLQAAICSVIFEALSIESLINFFGAVTLGDDIFYKKYEAKKRYSTLKKLEEICKQEFSTPYPVLLNTMRNCGSYLKSEISLCTTSPCSIPLFPAILSMTTTLHIVKSRLFLITLKQR